MPSALFSRRGLVAILAVAFVVTGGLAYAAIPDAGGVIHTCYTKSSGAWRVIDTSLGQTCKSNEAALDLYSKGGADALFLDQTEANALYLGKAEKAADADKLDGKDSTEFLGATATAADSSKLGGIRAAAYVVGGGVLGLDAGNLSNGGSSSLTCCPEFGLTPPMTFEIRCDTSGNTRLVVSSIGSFHWWWDGTFGNAAPLASGFQAEFAIGNGVERNSLRAINSGNTTAIYDLDTSIGATCNFGWTVVQGFNQSPGP
ncbi:MAG TPA: hypothetical protein VJ807_07920 [Gaiellaceae bacterium]|nr:hypothetical protein [Gaiellaceae bacterium]